MKIDLEATTCTNHYRSIAIILAFRSKGKLKRKNELTLRCILFACVRASPLVLSMSLWIIKLNV
jgi:hypothetical protein